MWDCSLNVLVTSQSITVSSLVSAISAPNGIITMFITLLFALSNGFVKLFLSIMKNKKVKHEKIALLATVSQKNILGLIYLFYTFAVKNYIQNY